MNNRAGSLLWGSTFNLCHFIGFWERTKLHNTDAFPCPHMPTSSMRPHFLRSWTRVGCYSLDTSHIERNENADYIHNDIQIVVRCPNGQINPVATFNCWCWNTLSPLTAFELLWFSMHNLQIESIYWGEPSHKPAYAVESRYILYRSVHFFVLRPVRIWIFKEIGLEKSSC